MYSKELEELIEVVLADGSISEIERKVLHKRAITEGVDLDELDIVLEGRLSKIRKQVQTQMPPDPNVQQRVTTEKFGNVEKCPSCGAQVVGGNARCPECGYNFSNVAANSSAEKLANKLQELSEREAAKHADAAGMITGLGKVYGSMFSQMANNITGRKDPKVVLIENFPVPNTRADLLEFLTSIQPRAKKPSFFTKGNNSFAMEHAYWTLYSNCINKARISYANDLDFQFFFEDFKIR